MTKITTSSFPSISCLSITSIWTIVMSVGASPLNMNKFTILHDQVCWEEIILNCWVHLHDVSAFTPHIQVVDGFGIETSAWPRFQHEHVGAVLEGAAELSCIDSEAQR